MKIAFVNNQYQLGGAETIMQQLYRGCLQAGHEADVIVAEGKTYPPGVMPMYPRLLSRLSHSRFSGEVEKFFPRQHWTNRAFEKLAELKYDLIHIHNFHGHYATIEALAKLNTKKPLLWTMHGYWAITGGCDTPRECQRYQTTCGECPYYQEWPMSGVDDTAAGLMKKKACFRDSVLNIVTPSRQMARKVQQSQVGKNWNITHIPNGVQTAQFGYARKRDATFRHSLRISSDSIALLITNRNFLDPNKGFSLIADALETIPADGVDIILAGNNSHSASQALARFRCRDFGYVSDRGKLAELYEVADLFLFASYGEIFPCAILEAMSSACQIVATPTGGVLEQIETGASGYLSERIDAESFAGALKLALYNFDPRQNPVGQAARQRAESEFSEEKMIERYFKVYWNILSAQSQSRVF